MALCSLLDCLRALEATVGVLRGVVERGKGGWLEGRGGVVRETRGGGAGAMAAGETITKGVAMGAREGRAVDVDVSAGSKVEGTRYGKIAHHAAGMSDDEVDGMWWMGGEAHTDGDQQTGRRRGRSCGHWDGSAHMQGEPSGQQQCSCDPCHRHCHCCSHCPPHTYAYAYAFWEQVLAAVQQEAVRAVPDVAVLTALLAETERRMEGRERISGRKGGGKGDGAQGAVEQQGGGTVDEGESEESDGDVSLSDDIEDDEEGGRWSLGVLLQCKLLKAMAAYQVGGGGGDGGGGTGVPWAEEKITRVENNSYTCPCVYPSPPSHPLYFYCSFTFLVIALFLKDFGSL